jgi:hypothetical protein
MTLCPSTADRRRCVKFRRLLNGGGTVRIW